MVTKVPNTKQAIANVSLTLKTPAQPVPSGSRSPNDTVLYEGWLLKKRRKKLQGYARRYFALHISGLLSYSFDPSSDVRDQIFLQTAAISSSPGRRDIHVDSGTVTFHIKCLTQQDFNLWMSALRKFIAPGGGDSEKTTLRRSQTVSPAAGTVHRAAHLLEEMGQTIHELAINYYEHEDDDRKSAMSDRSHQANRKSKEKESHSLLNLFRKPPASSPATTPQQRFSFNKDALPKGSPHVQSSEVVFASIVKLREQHETLSELIHNLSSMSILPAPALQRVLDEGSTSTLGIARTPMSAHARSAMQRASMSSVTDSSIWYDAEEHGAEEYIVQDDQPEPEDEKPTLSRGSSAMTGNESLSTERYSDEEDAEVTTIDDEPDEKLDLPVNRRTRLPARPSGDEGSLFAILKKNVGQDLSNIAFPVSFNEPLSLLQRIAEELEYYELLEKAVQTSDWVERMSYVAAFAVSGYACTKFRSGRKGFTPLVGETFEDARTHFIAEKVVHKPLLVAFHAEGPSWELNGTSSGKTKFWGKSFEVIPTGITRLRIGDENFEWTKPSSFTRNLMMGAKYLEHCGEMIVKNTTTGATCVLDFKETGYWASTPNVVSGSVNSPDGHVTGHLEGKWDEQLSQKLGSNHLKVLWRISPFPRDAAEYYGYTYFGITLNELTEDLKKKLPPTDSRFRPDIRALEEGNVDLAEEEKLRVEQMQRDRRERGLEVRPRWFKQVGESDNWVYAGGYWEERRADWKNSEIRPLW